MKQQKVQSKREGLKKAKHQIAMAWGRTTQNILPLQTSRLSRDSCCPAKNKECGKCGARGHFAVCCGNKKASSSSQKEIVPGNMKKTYLVAERASREGDGYAFTVGVGLRVEEVTPKGGGALLDSVLINSGASCNLIDHSTWNSMKQNCFE